MDQSFSTCSTEIRCHFFETSNNQPKARLHFFLTSFGRFLDQNYEQAELSIRASKIPKEKQKEKQKRMNQMNGIEIEL